MKFVLVHNFTIRQSSYSWNNQLVRLGWRKERLR